MDRWWVRGRCLTLVHVQEALPLGNGAGLQEHVLRSCLADRAADAHVVFTQVQYKQKCWG
jgi:hypothetical protein